ncbi:MAG: DUF1553 domain-containing protein [Chthoniobacter sp.]|nr:DUF1553 domain-containing protein [Chthoniobacter sp.]
MFCPSRPALFSLLALLPMAGWGAERLEFNRDIRPILSENCFYCHGQDPNHRKANLRLDQREVALHPAESGDIAIVPGKPEASALVERVNSREADEQMPPPKSNRILTPEQKEMLKRWIAEGAEYQSHWAFVPPVRPPLPEVHHADWSHNAVDRFILAKLEQSGLEPSPEAPPEAWLRRASFDLTGLPPTLAELDAFSTAVREQGEAAYAAETDRLLASPHFGERLAIDWLDAARYADTHGFNNDSGRTMWRWRDWVINAFNANMPYDRFITEQLAGDELPHPTLDQRIATGFCRNHVINSEGGIIDEEYRVEYVSDRVRTLSMSWLGLTMECSRCHDHKFDPITQRDYYSLFAFFNQVPEYGEDGRVANAAPILPAPTPEQAAEIAHGETETARWNAQLEPKRAAWQWTDSERPALEQAIATATAAAPTKGLTLVLNCDDVEPKKDFWDFPAAKPALVDGITGKAWASTGEAAMGRIDGQHIAFDRTEGVTVSFWLQPDPGNAPDVAILSNQNYEGRPAAGSYAGGESVRMVGSEIEVRLSLRFPAYAIRVFSEGAALAPGAWRQISVTYSGGKKAANVRIFVDGRELPTRILADGLDGGLPKAPFILGGDADKTSPKLKGRVDQFRSFDRPLSREEIHALFAVDALPFALARAEAGTATARDRSCLAEAALEASDSVWRDALNQRDQIWEQHLALRREAPTTMVMSDLPEPRPTFVLRRGQYDAPTDRVEPGVPEKLLGAWPADAPRNRLGLARWLTRPDQPLTARVVVNRFWAQLFGTGIVKTLEDFGAQGEWPSHPELLDWLARDFMDSGWNVKALFKTMVLSSTYRQNSSASPASLARDPENRLLARGPRFRLPAELIRDQALTVAGLIRHRVGGPSVHPYQPAGLYNNVVVGADYPGTKWIESTGDDLYRRSLYTFWKRTVPHPAMLTFDAPDREFCQVRRSRTNTPLQALVLLNEPAFVEAARELGARMLTEGGPSDADRIAYGFRLATSRRPLDRETEILTHTLQRLRDDFTHDPDAANAFLAVGSPSHHPNLAPTELAAAAGVANMILNLDATLTK